MIRVFMLLGLLIGLSNVGFAQVIIVTDSINGEPLELVTLSSDRPNAFTTTNSKGEADISAFVGAEQIVIRTLSYKTKVSSYADLSKQGFKVGLKYMGISLEGMVVSASRRSESRQEVSSKITTISPAEITIQNPPTTADLLATSGEVFIQKSQLGGGSPIIRGFSTNRLLLTVDGVRMNTAIFRSGNVQNVISMDAFATESVEVLFGPGSIIYGSDAIGGVMSFQTLSPQFTLSDKALITGNALSRYASASKEQTYHLDVNLGFKKWAFVTSITHSDFDDLRMGKHGPKDYLRPFYAETKDGIDAVVSNDDPLIQKPTGYAQTNFMEKVRFNAGKNWELNYGFHYSTTTDYPRYDRHIRLRDGLPRSAEWNYGPQEWMMNNVSIAHMSDGKLYHEMNVRLAHQFFEESRINRDFNEDERSEKVENVNAYSANIDFTKRIKGKNKLYYGFEGVRNDVNSKATEENIATGSIIAAPTRYPESTWSSYAGYLSYQHELSSSFLLQGGARYNQFNIDAAFDTAFYDFNFTEAQVNNAAVTGSFGIVYQPTEKMTIRVNTSTGFRSPNIDDVGKVFDSEQGAVVVPNPNLKAENAYNAEAGIEKIFGDRLKWDLTVFYTILEDALVRRNFVFNGQDSILYEGELSQVQAIQNAAVAEVYGFQTGFEFEMPLGFGLSSRFNYQKGEEELDDGSKSPMRHAAPWFGVSHLKYSRQKLTLDFYLQYSGEISYKNLAEEERGKAYLYALDADGNPYSPGWYTLNFKALYPITKHLMISGGVENITDQRYRPYSSGLAAAGRNLILSLKATF